MFFARLLYIGWLPCLVFYNCCSVIVVPIPSPRPWLLSPALSNPCSQRASVFRALSGPVIDRTGPRMCFSSTPFFTPNVYYFKKLIMKKMICQLLSRTLSFFRFLFFTYSRDRKCPKIACGKERSRWGLSQ